MPKITATIFLIACTVFLNLSCIAQSTKDKKENPYADMPLKDRLFFGGGFGLSFGTITFIRLAPVIGVNISPKFSVGAGPSYQYYKDSRPIPDFETSIYGGSAFGRYFVLQSIFLQSEFEVLNLERFGRTATTGELARSRVNVPILFVGGGFSQRTSNGSGFFIGAFYDIIQDINSPYPNNVSLRVGGFLSL